MFLKPLQFLWNNLIIRSDPNGFDKRGVMENNLLLIKRVIIKNYKASHTVTCGLGL